MNVFLSELALSFANKQILLVLDGAGWHRSRELVVPGNIELFFLPPYSPELNPVENLW
jgi:transposase